MSARRRRAERRSPERRSPERRADDRRAGTGRAPLRAWRWPALVLVPALIAAAVVVSRADDESAAAAAAVVAMPLAGGPDAAGSTWYCAGGTATGTPEGAAEQTVVVVNGSGQARRGRLTAYPSEGAVAVRDFEVPAHERVDLPVSEVVTAPWAAALVEVDGGEIAVQHVLAGPEGRTVAPCASSPASSWFVPAGTTQPGARMVLAVFNPFPGEAVIDVTFETDEGTTRRPQPYESLVVAGGSVAVLEVTDVVTLRPELATTVRARSGRVVVDQLQIADGSGDVPAGLAAVLAAPEPATAWIFPDGVGAVGYGERVVVQNPTEEPAEVDVQVLLDDPATNGLAEPFELTVEPGGYGVVDVFADGRVPVGVAHQILVRSRNDVAVVAQRVISGGADASLPGLSATMGSPDVATRWLVPVGSAPGAVTTALIVANPSASQPATVTVRAVAGGGFDVVEGLDALVVAPASRVVIELGPDALGLERLALDVGSDRPVVAEMRFGFDDPPSFAYVIATPVAGSVAAPTDLVGELSIDTIVVGG